MAHPRGAPRPAFRVDLARGRRARRFYASLVAIAGAVLAPEATAQIRPLRLDYEAPEGCPRASAFLDEVTSRTNRTREAAPGEEALQVRVRITRAQALHRGRVTLGQDGTREVDGSTCQEVVAALALITALKVDPEASFAPRSQAAQPRSSDGQAPAPPPAPPQPTAAPSSSAPAPTPRRPPRVEARSAPVAAPPAREVHWTVGMHAGGAFDVAPRPLVGGGPFLELDLRAARGRRSSARLALEIATTGPVDLGPGGARFTRGIGRLDACPAFLRPTRWLALALCLGAEGGFLRGEGLLGRSVSQVNDAVVPWASLGSPLRVTVDAGDILRVDIQGGPQFPLVRRSFVFETPPFVIHEVPPVTSMLRLGFGGSFW